MKFSLKTKETIGHTLATSLLKKRPETKNKYHFISSFSVSMNDILAAFEKATGGKWDVKHVDSDEMIKEGKRKISEGDVGGGSGILAFAVNVVEGSGKGDDALEGVEANEILGVKQEDVNDAVRKLVTSEADGGN